MPIPPGGCSDNCGDGDIIPQFVRIYIPIPIFPYSEYFSGKLYEFDSVEVADDRCLYLPVEASSFWDIEKVSRYPRGWNFPNSAPIPGKWTWRVSVDRITPPIVLLNGWSIDLDRHSGIPDPTHNCTTDQTLTNYVPLAIRPNILLETIYDVTPPDPTRQFTSPCFCASECPLSTRPHRAYLVRSSDITCGPDYTLGKLYRVVSADFDGCAYQPQEAETAPATADLDKRDATPTTGDHAYDWVLVIDDGAGCVNTFIETFEWSDDNTPDPMFGALCGGSFTLSESGGPGTATITPVPWRICTDAAARTYVTDRES